MKNVTRALVVIHRHLKPDLKMKLTYLFLVLSFLQIHANGYGQKEKITLDLESVTVNTVFQEIQSLTNYKFLYNTRYLNLDRKVSIVATNEKLSKVLNKIFKGTNVTYKILDEQIVLKLKTTENTTISTLSSSNIKEQQQLTGTVLDAGGLPLPGVTVLIKGTQRGTTTDFDGNYSISATTGEILVFSYLGFLDKEIAIGNAIVYNVGMEPTSLKLEEVELYATGYQKISKEQATGSFAQVEEKTLDIKTNQNILDNLIAETPGVLFNEGVNGSNNGLLIRGASTINAGTNPLIVVDGFPTDGDISNINPNDIESITVLKDAAAAAIYGIQAGNGVIVIVTKRGKRNTKLNVQATVNTSITRSRDLTDNDTASASDQVDFNVEQYNAFPLFGGFLFREGELIERQNFSIIRSPIDEILLQRDQGVISSAEAETRLDVLRGTDARDEFRRRFLSNVIWRQYVVSASGGSEKHDYRASLTYNDNQGENIAVSSDDFILNVANNFQLTKKLKLSSSIQTSFTDENFGVSSSGLNSDFGSTVEQYLNTIPFTRNFVDDDGNFVPAVRGASQEVNNVLEQRGFLPYTYNLQQEYDNNDNTRRGLNLRAQAVLEYQIIKGLSIEGRYQYEDNSSNGRNLLNTERFATRNIINNFSELSGLGGDVVNRNVPLGDIASFTERNFRSNTGRVQLSFNQSYKSGLHKVSAIAGSEIRNTITESRFFRFFGFNEQSLVQQPIDAVTIFPGVLPNFNSAQIPDGNGINFLERRFISYYGNAAYTYDDRYTLTSSIRLDDTNLFGVSSDTRNIPLYSVGGRWNVGREDFFNVDAITNLQLRASYGVNGNSDINTSPFLQASPDFDNSLFNNRFSGITSVPNPLLRLERVETFNLGLDLGLFKNKVNLTADFYVRNSSDVLADRTLDPTLGVSTARLNFGELRNTGVDFSLNVNVLSTKNFKYTTTINATYNKNEVISVDTPLTNVNSFIFGNAPRVGDPLNNIFSIEYAGLDRNGRPQFFDETGEIIDSGTAITSVDALQEEGTLTPVYFGSWINTFTYKNFTLRALTTFTGGHVFRNFARYNPAGLGARNTFEDFADRWRQPGDENFTDVPRVGNRLVPTEGDFNYRLIDNFVDSAARIALREVILSYSFDQKVAENLGLNSLNLNFQANNIAVWNFNRWNIDPLNQLLPLQTRFNLGVNVSF